MASFDLSQKFDPTWTANDMVINVNGVIDIPAKDLLDYEVMWYGPEVHGVLAFLDYNDIASNAKFAIGGFLKVSFTSQYHSLALPSSKFEKIFSITKVQDEAADQGRQKVVEVHFVDMITTQLKYSFVTKSYEEMKPSEAFGEYLTELNLGEFIIVPDVEEKEMTIITPAHISGYEYLNKEFKYRGLSIIQDRSPASRFLVHDSMRTNDKAVSTGELFEFKPNDVASRGQVIEYNIEGLDMNSVMNSTPSMSNTINNENTNLVEMDVKVTQSEIIGSGSIGGVATASLHVQKGQKQSTSNSRVSNETLAKDLLEAQKMSIWVPGWNGNRLAMKVKVEMPRPVNIEQGESSEAYSGEWVVNKVRDKMINSYFIQELFLTRAGAI